MWSHRLRCSEVGRTCTLWIIPWPAIMVPSRYLRCPNMRLASTAVQVKGEQWIWDKVYVLGLNVWSEDPSTQITWGPTKNSDFQTSSQSASTRISLGEPINPQENSHAHLHLKTTSYNKDNLEMTIVVHSNYRALKHAPVCPAKHNTYNCLFLTITLYGRYLSLLYLTLLSPVSPAKVKSKSLWASAHSYWPEWNTSSSEQKSLQPSSFYSSAECHSPGFWPPLSSLHASGSPPLLHIGITWGAFKILHAQVATQITSESLGTDPRLHRWFQWAAMAENHSLDH